MAASGMATDQLVTTPRPLDHFDCLAVCKATVALRTSEWRRDEGLVGLSIWAAEEIREKPARL